MSEIKPWDKHYKSAKSVLMYPDENLVRLVKAYLNVKSDRDIENISAIDLGCGTGRHLKMLHETGIKQIIGLDYSMNGLKICKEIYPVPLVQADNSYLPFIDASFDIAVSWGSLHYCEKDRLAKQIGEICRILKKGGRFFGTLRSDKDTYLKKGRHIGNDTWITNLDDIKNSVVSFYNENELKSCFKIFSKFEYGVIERTIIGDMSKRISHWIFRAEKA
jgi:ubiquinone/menaquinone biosynthesis C-methylase UbiE